MLLEARDLTKTFKRHGVKAVDRVSFSLEKGRTLGVVGESGCGKSTLAKLVLGLLRADSGTVSFEGRSRQIIFQSPFLSLDPRMKISDALKEPFVIRGERRKSVIQNKTRELLESVELGAGFADRYPRELSGGECQRVAIARAIALEPELVVCDEPVSALDVLVQAQILNLLLRLQKEKGVSYLFISHNLRVVRHMSDDILVMKDGQICEAGPRDQIFNQPAHPYTKLLIQESFI